MTTNVRRPNRMPSGAVDLLESVPCGRLDRVLDIGTGNGFAAEYMARQGCDVVATGIGIDHWGTETAFPPNVTYCQADVTGLPFRDGQFDGVWLSHVLEHVGSIEDALAEIRRVLAPEGRLFISVPPYKPLVVGGHYSPGWTPGQLLYVLLVNGFRVADGDFFYHGYNVHGRVTRLPDARFTELRAARSYDGQELPALADFLPPAVRAEVDEHGNFDGLLHVEGGRQGTLLERGSAAVQYLKHALLPAVVRRYPR